MTKAEHDRLYRERHKEQIRSRQHKYYALNKDKVRAQNARWRKDNPEVFHAALKRQHKARKEEWRHVFDDKGMNRCSRCGYDKCFAALDFHHVIPGAKERNVAALMLGRPNPKALEELDKCIVLCSNCHRELHDAEKEE